MTFKFFHSKKPRKPVYSSEHVSLAERLGEDAYVGWAMVVSISLLIAVAFIAYAVRLFLLVDSGSIAAPQTALAPARHSVFDQSALESLIGQFGDRSAASAALDRGYVGPADPSQ